MIDATAIIDPSAKLAADVTVGPYSVIGPNVEIGSGTRIGPHVVITRNTKLGKNNKIYQFASIGGDNQDRVIDNQPTYLEIGDDNVIHECVTINRGSTKENCITKLGNNNLLMAYSHVGHDSVIGSYVTFANGTTLAGHVVVEDYVTISAFCAIHQFCTIGAYAFVARGAMITQDVLPYVMVTGNDPTTHGINKIGLERNGFDKGTIKMLLTAYKIIFRSNLGMNDVKEQLSALIAECPQVKYLLNAIEKAQRGFIH